MARNRQKDKGTGAMTVKQAAQRLEVSVATVYGLIAGGKLRCNRIGLGRGVIRVSDDQLSDYLRRAEPTVKPPPAPARQVRLKHL
jgi:excisionase family DNA binding protein